MPDADQGAGAHVQKVTKKTTAATRKTKNGDGSYRPSARQRPPARPRGRPRTCVTGSATNPPSGSSTDRPELSSATQPVAEGRSARTSMSDVVSNSTSTTEPSNPLSTADDAYACFSLPGTGTINASPTTSRTSETTPAAFQKQHPPPTVDFSDDYWNIDGVQEDNIPLGSAFLEVGNTRHLDDTATVNGLFPAAWNPALPGSGHEAIAPTDLQHGFTAARPVPLTSTVGGRPGPFPLSAPADIFSTPCLPYDNMCRHCRCPNSFQSTFSIDPRTSLQSSGRVAACSTSMPQYQITPASMEVQWSLVPLTAFPLALVNVPNNGNPRSYR